MNYSYVESKLIQLSRWVTITVEKCTNGVFLPIYAYVRIDKLVLLRVLVSYILDMCHVVTVYYVKTHECSISKRGMTAFCDRKGDEIVVLAYAMVSTVAGALIFFTNAFENSPDSHKLSRDTVKFTVVSTLLKTLYITYLFFGKNIIVSNTMHREEYNMMAMISGEQLRG